MKKIISIILFTLSYTTTFSQEVIRSSIEMNAIKPILIKKNSFSNADADIGFSFKYSEYFEIMKLSVGIEYCPISYSLKQENFGFNQMVKYQKRYLNFPVYFTFPMSTKKTQLNCIAGIVLNHLFSYNVIVTTDNFPKKEYTTKNKFNLIPSLRVGAEFSQKIGNQFSLKCTSTFEYKPSGLPNMTEFKDSDFRSFEDQKFLLFLSIGVEYKFLKSFLYG